MDKEISIFDEEGLDLDSVEALDTGLEQKLYHSIDEIDSKMMSDILFNIDSIVEYVHSQLK